MPRTARTIINRANAERQTSGFWTDERVDTLRDMVGLKFSAAEIAATIGATRFQVIGKCHRLRIRLNAPQPTPKLIAPTIRERRREIINARIGRLRHDIALLEWRGGQL